MKKALLLVGLSAVALASMFGAYKLYQFKHPIYVTVNVPTSTAPVTGFEGPTNVGSSVGPVTLVPFVNAQRYFGCQTDGGCDLGTTTHRFRNLYLTGAVTGGASSSMAVADITWTNATGTNLTITGALTFAVPGIVVEPLNVANKARTVTTSIYSNRTGINSTTPSASLAIKGTAGLDLVNITSSSGASVITVSGSGSMTTTFNNPVVISQGHFGPLNFLTDSGIQAWVNLPITSAATNTVESYSAQIDGTGILTVWGLSNGSGGVIATSTRVGVNSTTPGYGFTVNGTVGMVGLSALSGATTPLMCVNTSTGAVTFQLSSCTVSSARFKEHIESLPKAELAEKARKVRAVAFDYKIGGKDIGYIAEEIAEIEPMLVIWTSDYTAQDLEWVKKNYPKSVKCSGKSCVIPQTVDYDKMSILLFAYTQTLDDRVSILENQNPTSQVTPWHKDPWKLGGIGAFIISIITTIFLSRKRVE